MIREDFNWTEEAVLGLALLIKGGEVDSFGDQINGYIFYEVGKHKRTGKVVMIPTERNLKHEFINDSMNRRGMLN